MGGETAYSQKLKGFYDDAFTLEAEIIELKEKQSVPIGETGWMLLETNLFMKTGHNQESHNSSRQTGRRS